MSNELTDGAIEDILDEADDEMEKLLNELEEEAGNLTEREKEYVKAFMSAKTTEERLAATRDFAPDMFDEEGRLIITQK